MVEPIVFSECCFIDDDRRLRQGDVFEWFVKDQREPWTKLGIIVTADCDIAHKKHRGILSYVPVLELRDYLRIFHLPAKLEKACVSVREQLVKMIRNFQAEHAPEFSQPISEEAALRWILEVTAESVANDLSVPAGKNRDRFLALAGDYVASEAALSDGTFDVLLDGFVRARSSQMAGATRDKIISGFKSDVETLICNLPGDAFFLGSAGPSHRGGYVAYLRLVREIEQSCIAIKQSDLRDSSKKSKRIASLTSPYVYRLTQQLAEVFAAIGLPKEYEDARRDVVQRIT